MDMGMDMAMPGMGGGGIEMGDMELGDGVPTAYELQRRYWAVVGAVLALATLANLFEKILCWQRLRAARHGYISPARPKNMIMILIATSTAIYRELAHFTVPAPSLRRLGLQMSTLGSFALASAQLVLVLLLCFDRIDPTTSVNWENTAYRIGYISTAQLPLVYILSGKNNLIGFITGMGYEKLNWLHRWTARVLFVTVTMHMILWFENWAQYDYIMTKLKTESITQRGFAAWVLLLWIVVSSSRPFRGLGYEFFIVQHVFTISGFSAAVYLHLPADMKYVLWVSVAFAIFDRLARVSNVVFLNLNVPCLRRGSMSLGYPAKTERLAGGVTRVTIKEPHFAWTVGQHVYLACQRIAPLQSHPFSISSIPSDGKLTLLVKAQRGSTQAMHTQASDHLPVAAEYASGERLKLTTVEGPYGRIRPLHQFDSIVFFAGGIGSTVTVPLMRDLVLRSTNSSNSCVTKHIRFIWAVKSCSHLCWFAEEMNDAIRKIEEACGQMSVALDISLYITCESQSVVQSSTSVDNRSLVIQQIGKGKDAEKGAKNMTVVHNIQDSCDDRQAGKQLLADNDTITNANDVANTFNEKAGDENGQGIKSNSIATPTCISRNVTNDGSVGKTLCTNTKDLSSSPKSKTGCPNKLDQQTPLLPSIRLFQGRPSIREIIRQSLEQARGESAVVACGPGGMVADVRTSVVGLSDERAVHKGTGAQGIYLHTQGYGL